MKLKSFRASAALIFTTVMLIAMATTVATAQTFTVLDSFTGTNGLNSFSGLVQATNGNLYGTGLNGGNRGGGDLGCPPL